ncbi:unnamed protein product, partial [Rotaria magnacalcarata]
NASIFQQVCNVKAGTRRAKSAILSTLIIRGCVAHGRPIVDLLVEQSSQSVKHSR